MGRTIYLHFCDALAQQVTTSQLTRVFEAPDRFDAGLELDAEEQYVRPVTFARCPRKDDGCVSHLAVKTGWLAGRSC